MSFRVSPQNINIALYGVNFLPRYRRPTKSSGPESLSVRLGVMGLHYIAFSRRILEDSTITTLKRNAQDARRDRTHTSSFPSTKLPIFVTQASKRRVHGSFVMLRMPTT